MDSPKHKIANLISKSKKFLLDFLFKFISFSKFKKLDNNHNNEKNQIELDKKLVFSLAKSRIPNLKQLKYIKRFLSKKEFWILYICFSVVAVSLIFSGIRFYCKHLQVVPVRGGTYIEGLIGLPKYINPLYANISDVDSDIGQLIYSSLFKRGKDGELIRDLVESYEVSKDNKIYTFTIRQDVKWHDSNFLTIDDIIFTFNTIKDSKYKSPLRPGFIGVEIEKVDNRGFKFILSNPYAAFLELLTFGIMPIDLWYQISPESASLAELNLKPIGSGPYKFDTFIKDKQGNIKEYNLVINENYYGQLPYIDNVSYRFFSGFEEAVSALNDNIIEGISYLPQEFKKEVLTPNTLNFHKLYIPQLTVIFFNQQASPGLADRLVRQALTLAINRQKIVNEILAGDAYIVDGPILPNSFAYYQDITKYRYNITEANQLLEKAGWLSADITEEEIAEAASFIEALTDEQENESGEGDALDPEQEKIKQEAALKLKLGVGQWRKKGDNYLIIKLSTVERNENEQIITAIKNFWESVGVKTELEILPANQMQLEIIKPRNFEALFYGQVVGADPDPYAFWHSSQIGENGLNIANFSNKEADQLLEDARLISDPGQRQEKYWRFQEILVEELPVIFMYSPTYTYVQNKKINNFSVNNILYPYDRFANINEWYIETGKKWEW